MSVIRAEPPLAVFAWVVECLASSSFSSPTTKSSSSCPSSASPAELCQAVQTCLTAAAAFISSEGHTAKLRQAAARLQKTILTTTTTQQTPEEREARMKAEGAVEGAVVEVCEDACEEAGDAWRDRASLLTSLRSFYRLLQEHAQPMISPSTPSPHPRNAQHLASAASRAAHTMSNMAVMPVTHATPDAASSSPKASNAAPAPKGKKAPKGKARAPAAEQARDLWGRVLGWVGCDSSRLPTGVHWKHGPCCAGEHGGESGGREGTGAAVRLCPPPLCWLTE